jgi:hypothetical protein
MFWHCSADVHIGSAIMGDMARVDWIFGNEVRAGILYGT